ncbi:hypothetical protein NCCP2648_28290 [Lacticaseibacillus rhamnosus]|nr:hypothetical protein NCCP2648_28290 [Lacticaseibacillus rhamnosus]
MTFPTDMGLAKYKSQQVVKEVRNYLVILRRAAHYSGLQSLNQ